MGSVDKMATNKVINCKETEICINCKQHNVRFNTDFNIHHNVRDKQCLVYDKELNNLRNRINYGSQ